MDWQKLAVLLRLTEAHLDAWHQALRDAALLMMQVPPDERGDRMDRLRDRAHAIMAELQKQQAWLYEVRSEKLSSLFRLP